MTQSPYKALTLCVQMYVYTCSCVWEHVHVCVQRLTLGIFLDCPPLSLLRQNLFLSPEFTVLASLATQHALGIHPHLSFLSEGLQAGHHTILAFMCMLGIQTLVLLAQQVLDPLSHLHSPGPTFITDIWGPPGP